METHKGTVVSTIPTEEVEELFEVRAMLECDLLVRAIPAMTDRDVAESREALDGLEDSYRKEDISAWGRLNWAFHRRLYEPARPPPPPAIHPPIHLQTKPT